jgi:hypothetical protein
MATENNVYSRNLHDLKWKTPKTFYEGERKMKKILFLIVILVLLLLTACTAQVIPAPTPNLTAAKEMTSVQTESPTLAPTITPSPSNSDIKYAEMIPDPKVIFANGDISVTDGDGGKAYIFEVTGYADGEYESYISKCKEMGFNDVTYETNEKRSSDFGAYTNNGEYWVEVSLDKEKDIIYVICQTSKKK